MACLAHFRIELSNAELDRFLRAIFVGDRLYEDVRGASEVGTTVQALWFRADEHPQAALPKAFSMLDVVDIVRKLRGSALAGA